MGNLGQLFGYSDPWDTRGPRGTITAMTSPDPLRDPVSALVEAAHAFHRAADTRGSHRAAPDSLVSLQEALQVLSAAWYRLAADAVTGGLGRNPALEMDSGASRSRGDLSREQQVRLIGGLHDVAAAFARCSRACRQGGSTVTPVIARRAPGDATGAVDDELSWFASGMPPTERAA
jgi:hypothetical protein